MTCKSRSKGINRYKGKAIFEIGVFQHHKAVRNYFFSPFFSYRVVIKLKRTIGGAIGK